MEVYNIRSAMLLVFFGLLCFLTSNSGFVGINAEETCSWKPDGTQVCKDDADEESHNVWTELSEDEGVTENADNIDSETINSPETQQRYNLNDIEVELFVLFAGQLKDWKPQDGLAKFNPEVIVLAILNAFNEFDQNDDGFLEFAEFETVLSQRQNENLDKIKENLKEYPDERISIFTCLKIFQKFNGGKETVALLTPYQKLQYMPPAGAKRIIQGSVQMFVDSDKNYDGKLNKEEFSFGMKRAQEKRKEIEGKSVDVPPEQLDALFSLVDKDGDENLTYFEFQGTIPDKPKTFGESIDEVFEQADTNSDGELSEREFETYMENRSKKENTNFIPTDKEIAEAFEKLDENEDGSLSRDELMKMFEEVKKAHELRIMEAFNGFDKDADGSLSMDELEVIVKGVEQTSGQKLDAKVFMTMLDQDMDQKVSLDEMTVVLSKLIK